MFIMLEIEIISLQYRQRQGPEFGRLCDNSALSKVNVMWERPDDKGCSNSLNIAILVPRAPNDV